MRCISAFLQVGWCRTLLSFVLVCYPMGYGSQPFTCLATLPPQLCLYHSVSTLHLSFSLALFLLHVTVGSRPTHDVSSRFICQLGEASVLSLSSHPLSLGRAPALALWCVSCPGHVPWLDPSCLPAKLRI